MTQNQTKPSSAKAGWEERFDKLWEDWRLNGWSYPKAKERNAVKSFIASELEKQREELLAWTSVASPTDPLAEQTQPSPKRQRK